MKRLTKIFSPLTRVVCICAVTSLVGGCAMTKLTSGLGSGLWGSNSKKSQVTNATPPKVSEDVLLAAAKSDVSGSSSFPSADSNCPKFVVWPNDRRLTKYEAGKEGDSLAIEYRGEITKNARECSMSPSAVSVKFGIAGKVLLGPKGQSGSINLPLVVHVTGQDRQKISSQTYNVPVNVSRDNPIGYFSLVKEISFNIPTGGRPLDYKLFVAFQKQGGSS